MVTNFRELTVWQEAHQLVLMIYKATATFPSNEQFGLTSQMRRAAVSVPGNIVEGFKRQSHPDKLRFYNIAAASLEELKYYLILSGIWHIFLRIDYSISKLNPSADCFIALSKVLDKIIRRT